MKSIPLKKVEGHVDVPARLRLFNKQERHAVLATTSGGKPYTSLVAYALTPDGRGILFPTPKKTTKYKNIIKNKNISLLIDTRSNSVRGYMESEAITILGCASPVRKGKRRDELARIFIRKHPRLAEFVLAPSTSLVLIEIRRAIHAGTFQTVSEWTNERE
jgi:hypothetical protein